MSFHAVKTYHFLTLVKGTVQCVCALLKLCPNAAVEDNGSSLRAERGSLIAATCPNIVWFGGKVNAQHLCFYLEV